MIRLRAIGIVLVGLALMAASLWGVALGLAPSGQPAPHHGPSVATHPNAAAAELGHALCSVSDLTAPESRRIITQWLAQQPEPLRVTLTIESHQPETFTAPGWVGQAQAAHVLPAAEAAILRDGRVWARVAVAAQPPVTHITPWTLLNSLRPWLVGGISFVVFTIGFIRRRRARSVAALWSGAQQRVTQTLDFLAEGIAVLDPRGRIVFANSSLAESIELDRDSMRGRLIDELGWCRAAAESADPADVPAGVPWKVALESTSATVRGQVRWRLSDGTERVLNVSCRSIQSGRRVHGVVAAFDDITLIEMQRVQLREARDAADNASAAKSVFLANMSHEIRTPIGGVMGTLELLGLTPLRERQRQYVRAAQGSASALLHLINDILDFSKIEAGRLELSPIACDLESCVESALRVVSRVAADKNLELVLDAAAISGLRVMADPERLRQVLINLTGNAIKFTSAGEVEVSVAKLEQSDGRVRLRFAVRDTGIGIPADRLDRLFKSFSQVDASTSRKYGGTGLGLAISKQLVELMGGRIAVDSTVGTGSTFHFELPLPLAAPADAVAPITPTPADTEPLPRLIVCDACTAAGAAIKAAIRAAGLAGDVVTGDAELCSALAACPADQPACVIIGGIAWTTAHETTARLAAARRDTRVVAMMLRDPGAVEEARLQPLISGWIQKPMSASGLVTQLRAALRGGSVAIAPGAVLVLDPVLARGKRILVAEDHPVGQLVTIDLLRSIGLECTIFDRGDKVVETALAEPVDLILMDGQLPHMDGFQATQEIRRVEGERGGRRTPIVALTAGAMRGDRERCLAAGMDDYVTKPISRAALAEAVSRALKIPLIAGGPPAIEPAAPTPVNSATPPEPPSADAPILVSELHDRCGRSIELATEMLSIFESSTRDDLARLINAMSANDPKATMQSAHAIAGCALQVGARALGTMARELEQRSRVESLDDLQSQLEAIKAEFDRCVAYLPTARQAAGVVSPPVSKDAGAVRAAD